jgi:hypothetical protein
VHHKDGNKTRNIPLNLECLCILCHANQNEHHIENFDKGRMKKELNSFIKKYYDELEKIGYPFIHNYERPKSK